MKVIMHNKDSPKLIVVSASGCTRSNSNIAFEDNHEEVDTLLIHHAVLASHRNPPDAEIMFFSTDTDVLVLVVANYHLFLRKTSISMVSGIIDVEPIAAALRRQRAKALASLHAFSGADTIEMDVFLRKR